MISPVNLLCRDIRKHARTHVGTRVESMPEQNFMNV